MKLSKCVEIGKACGLTTLHEYYENVRLHSGSLFIYSEIQSEMEELDKEIIKFFSSDEDINWDEGF